MPLTAGQVLQNRYRIDALLGQGGMGAVYRAWDLNLNIAVVVKENLIPSHDAQRQFSREAVLLATLRHPYLPRVTDHFFIQNQGQYLVMDFIEGEDLKQILANRGPIPEAQALDWMGQVLEALEYLHTEGVIHRDVKPANVKITPKGQVYLVDFGLAKLYDPLQQTTLGARGVTPGYAPPEQYGHGGTDARSDIYSAGATLYALLTGQQPPDALEYMTGRAEILPMRQVSPTTSPDVETAILQAMEIRPANRFQTAVEFRKSLLERTSQLSVNRAQHPAAAEQQPCEQDSVVHCPGCGSDDIKLGNTTPSGHQTYCCQLCGRVFSDKNVQVGRTPPPMAPSNDHPSGLDWSLHCPRCHLQDLKPLGPAGRGGTRFWCQACGQKFVDKEGHFRKANHPETTKHVDHGQRVTHPACPRCTSDDLAISETKVSGSTVLWCQVCGHTFLKPEASRKT